MLLAAIALAAGTNAALASHRAITGGQANAIAAAIAVRQSDLPSLKQQSNPITPQETRQNAQLTACVGGVPQTQALANTQSPNFVSSSGPSTTISSGTEILPSTALVAKDFAAVTGAHGLPCLLAELRGQLAANPPKGETVTSHAWRTASVVTGADGAFAFRFVVTLRQRRKTTTLILPLYVDLIGFEYGQAEVSLSVETVGSTPPPTSLERRLAALLIARAQTQIG
jgi:hypothetical protein